MSTHFDEQGNAHMVDVSDKVITAREATAEGWITLGEEATACVANRTHGEIGKQGDHARAFQEGAKQNK